MSPSPALGEFAALARRHWTAEREAKLTGGKRLLVKPSVTPELLRVLGLLNSDASMSADKTRKYLQINHMLTLLAPQLDDLADRHPIVRVLDAGCGNSFLTLLVTWYLRERLGKPCEVVGIDRDPNVIGQSRQRAATLGWSDSLRFAEQSIDLGAWQRAYRETFAAQTLPGDEPTRDDLPRPHLLAALHACDTASDAALALGVTLKADVLAVAPCCQAELANKWKAAAAQPHAFAPIFRSANLRRETAAQLTDALRMLLVRSRGYEVTATEFVESTHTPKNRLLLAVRRGNYLHSAAEQYVALRDAMAGHTIALEGALEGASASLPIAADGTSNVAATAAATMPNAPHDGGQPDDTQRDVEPTAN